MSRFFALCLFGTAVVSLLGQVSSALAQSPQLTVYVSYIFNDSAGPKPTMGVEVTVDNPTDSIAGFELWLKIDSTIPACFTLTTDGNPAYSITGSPVANFEYLTVKSLRGDGTDVKITGLAEGNFIPPFRRGFGPGISLIMRFEIQFLGGADMIPQPFAPISIDSTLQHFGFATPIGDAIGVTDGHLDTNLVKIRADSVDLGGGGCAATGDVNNDGVPLTLADLALLRDAVQGRSSLPSFEYPSDFNGDFRIDSADVSLLEKYFQQGLAALMPYPRPTSCYQTLVRCCEGRVGNIDGDPAQNVDVSDLTVMIQNMFINVGDPRCFGESDIDRSGGVDITDLTLLIDALFISLSPLPNCPLVGAGPLRAVPGGQ